MSAAERFWREASDAAKIEVAGLVMHLEQEGILLRAYETETRYMVGYEEGGKRPSASDSGRILQLLDPLWAFLTLRAEMRTDALLQAALA